MCRKRRLGRVDRGATAVSRPRHVRSLPPGIGLLHLRLRGDAAVSQYIVVGPPCAPPRLLLPFSGGTRRWKTSQGTTEAEEKQRRRVQSHPAARSPLNLLIIHFGSSHRASPPGGLADPGQIRMNRRAASTLASFGRRVLSQNAPGAPSQLARWPRANAAASGSIPHCYIRRLCRSCSPPGINQCCRSLGVRCPQRRHQPCCAACSHGRRCR